MIFLEYKSSTEARFLQMVHIGESIYKKCNSLKFFIRDNSIKFARKRFSVSKKNSSSKIVITDRLHAMLICAITGTPCIAFDNISKKVQGVCELWLEKFPYIKFVDSISHIN